METARLAQLEDALAAADWSAGAARDIVGATIRDLESPRAAAALAGQRAAIDRCFGQDTIEAMIAALEAEAGAPDSEWAAKTLEALRACSPTSLKVTVEQLRRGAVLGFDQAMIVEYRLSQAFLARHDFHEGIRAVVIDKDNAPRWDPPELAGVTQELVEAHFAALGPRDLSFD